jgi:hypothetical protein
MVTIIASATPLCTINGCPRRRKALIKAEGKTIKDTSHVLLCFIFGLSRKKKKKTSGKAASDLYKVAPLSPEDNLHQALRRLRWWLMENRGSIRAYFDNWDSEDIGWEDLRATLRYLEAPITSEQFNLLVKYLDLPSHPGNASVHLLMELESKLDEDLLKIATTTKLVETASAEEQNDDGKKKKRKKATEEMKDTTNKPPWQGEPCLQCNISKAVPPLEYQPKYVKLQLTLATFKDIHHHPAHFVITMTTSTTIHGLIDIIKNHLNQTTLTVAIFTNYTCGKEHYLRPPWTLETCGLEGNRTEHEPNHYQLYYDFIPDFIDCPILLSDTEMTRHLPPITKKKL